MDFPELEELISFMRSCYSPTNYNYIHFKVTRSELNSSAPVHTLSEASQSQSSTYPKINPDLLVACRCGQGFICLNLRIAFWLRRGVPLCQAVQGGVKVENSGLWT